VCDKTVAADRTELSQTRHDGVTGGPFNKDMKKRLVLVLIAVSAVTASVAAYYRTTGSDQTPQFITAAASRGDVVETVEATGTLQAVTTVQVGSQVSGTIQSLHADFNSKVRKGQVIARLDPAVLDAQVEQAQASVARLEADVERARIEVDDTQNKLGRAKQLFERGLIPATDQENAETAARQAQASLKAAQAQVKQSLASLNQNRLNLSHTVITAPVDGIVISRNVDVGQTVAASMSAPTLFEIAKDLAEMQVNASIDESDIGRIQQGQRVSFRVDAYPQDTFSGTVSQVRLDPVVAQNVVSYVTIIDVPNPDLKLKPGMTATVTVEVARADNVVIVPNAALRFRPTQEMLPQVARTAQQGAGQPAAGRQATSSEATPQRPGGAQATGARSVDESIARLWTLQDGQLRSVRVRTGISDGATTAIVGGELTETAQVVTGVATTSAAAAQPSSSPLLPFGGRRPVGGGNGGGRPGGTVPRAGAAR
jgi:HlyD family secretion protein